MFYQVSSNPKLAESYQPAGFYAPFLVRPLPAGVEPSSVFSPAENIMLKNFHVWNKMNAMPLAGSPLMNWLSVWCSEFPGDREELVRLFILLTRGMTTGNGLNGAILSRSTSSFGSVSR